jgi:flagellin-like hook-associated protein FlgL
MRITDSMRFSTMVSNLNNSLSGYSEISEQIATQQKVNRASDDPAAATRILDIQRGKAAIEQYKQNMTMSSSWIKATETTLSSAYEMLKTATGIALGSMGADTTTREYAAANVQDIIDSMRSLANSKWGDRYLFSGTRQDTAPFTDAPTVATIDPPQAAGSNTFDGTVVSSGAYTGDTNKTYTVKITSDGVLGAATYKFSTDGGRTWNTDVPDLTTPAIGPPDNGTIDLGDGVTLTFDDALGTKPFGENDVFYVNATAAGYYQGNDESLSLAINRVTVDEYSLTGAEVFTAAGAGGVDIFRTLQALKDALASDAVANTTSGTAVTAATLLKDVDGYTDYSITDTVLLEGTDTDGNAVSDDTLAITDTTTVGDLLDKIELLFGDVTASISSDGKLKVVDSTSGASLLAVQIGVRNADASRDATLQFNDGQTFILDQQKVLSDRVADLEKAQKQILLNQAECGTRTAHLEIVKSNVTAFDESLSSLLSETLDANVTELAMMLSMKEIALKSSYSIAAKLESTSILDFLQ